MGEHHGPDGQPPAAPVVGAVALDALGWMADRVALELCRTESDPDRQSDSVVRGDAATYPSEYWQWKHLWEVERGDESSAGPLPAIPGGGPLLSVIVPVNRPEPWRFRQCTTSVLAQTYENWELCLCGDGLDDPDLMQAMAEVAASDIRCTLTADSEIGTTTIVLCSVPASLCVMLVKGRVSRRQNWRHGSGSLSPRFPGSKPGERTSRSACSAVSPRPLALTWHLRSARTV